MTKNTKVPVHDLKCEHGNPGNSIWQVLGHKALLIRDMQFTRQGTIQTLAVP